ncbi:MAG: HAMP domain-containing histidine kinase [Syntrophomonadaceae bacterium]|nr:HAMP domain-containing histidine kinase [Syntrophomonadaceae bacterium]
MKSIFGRLMLTYVLIIAAAILLFSFFLSVLLKEHLFRAKEEEMLKTGYYLNTLLASSRRGLLTENELALAADVAGQTANARVVLFNMQNGGLPEQAAWRELLADEGLAGIMEGIWRGETVIRRRQFAPELGAYVVAVGVPSLAGERVTGAVILFSPLNELEGVLDQGRKVVWLSGAVLLCLALLIVYIVSRRLARPIVRVSIAAEAMASGIATADLEESGNDEIGRLVRSFNDLKNKLLTMEKMRRELIAGVSHELRSPLTAIRGFVQGMLDDVIPPRERPRCLALVLQETNRLTAMTNDLLEMAQLEAGGIVLQKKEFDLCRLVREMAELFAVQAKSKDIELVVCGCDREAPIFADSDRIKQVAGNLLSNAVKFTPAGGRVGLGVIKGEHGTTLKVWDTGPGIPAGDLPLVFEKFYRVEKSRDAATGGTGLGLSIARTIIELHGGHITLESDEKGTMAKVVFPEK